MVNIDDFVKRLESLLEYYNLNASSFADKIGVQRSSLSHLLSGRNKPSLDFILKILEVFPEVDLYWILNGKGTFPKQLMQLKLPVQ
jgi:transcriptional regulator with XRE-family HTH domain